jgi:hypothetical protein
MNYTDWLIVLVLELFPLSHMGTLNPNCAGNVVRIV